MQSDCNRCVFKSVYHDMGASCDVCTLHKDLSLAIAEINFYNKLKCCNSFLDLEQLKTFSKLFPDVIKIISEYISIKLKNEVIKNV